MIISFFRVMKFAIQDFLRNFWLSLVTIIILTVTFISISFLIIFNVIAGQSIKLVQEKIDISVYFKQEVAEKEVEKCNFQLLSLPWTKNIKYISKEKALERFKVKYNDNKNILESLDALDDNPLGATLIVTAKDIDGYVNIIEVLNSEEYKDKILNKNFNDYKEAVEKISLIRNKVKKVGIIISIIFVIIAILIVFYTIKIAIYTHKDEVIIKRLVGASNSFIKFPFLIQSVFFAIISCILAVVILYPLLRFINFHLESFFVGTEFNLLSYFEANIIVIMGWQLLGAILLTLVSSILALGKYLNN